MIGRLKIIVSLTALLLSASVFPRAEAAELQAAGAGLQATSAMVPESIFLRAGAIDAEPATEEQESVPDIGNIIFEHVLDSYEWHLTEWKGKPVAIHLPVILIDRGIHAFNSREILETGSYGRWHIAPEGAPHEGKIVREDGSKPFDISITKNVLQLMINAILLVLIVLLTARWYKRHDALKEHPTGIAALMEPLIMMIHDMARENIGEDDYRRYSPYLLTAFLFILLSNVIGIIPFFPGGANLTGNIACTLVLALFTFFTVNLTGTKHYYKEIFSPDVPGVLKPLMAVIETFSALVKPISLTIRLFANMLAGHIQILCMVSIIFIMAKYGPAMTGGATVITLLFGIFLDVLEILISFIQAYIFTMLSSIYIGMARAKGE